MSTELNDVTAVNNHTVNNTSFAGGATRNLCFQSTQFRSGNAHSVQWTKEQVVEQVTVMTEWLANN